MRYVLIGAVTALAAIAWLATIVRPLESMPYPPAGPGYGSYGDEEHAAAVEHGPGHAVAAEVVPIQNASLFEGRIVVGGQPTPEELATAAELGYVTVVDLREPGEQTEWDEGATVRDLGMNYVRIPVAGADGITQENARRVRAALDAAGDQPVLLHCGSGNRVGALLALDAYHQGGATASEAIALGLRHGLTRLEEVVRERLGDGP